MKTLLITGIYWLFLTLAPQPVTEADVTVYSTYKDFENRTGKDYETYRNSKHVMGKVHLMLTHEGKKVNVKCADMWGFRYKDALFRVHHKEEQPARVISVGRMCYYENGFAHLSMMSTGNSSADFSIGCYSYVSADLASELHCQSGMNSKANQKAMTAIDPIYAEYFDCIGAKGARIEVVRECVDNFQSKYKE